MASPESANVVQELALVPYQKPMAAESPESAAKGVPSQKTMATPEPVVVQKPMVSPEFVVKNLLKRLNSESQAAAAAAAAEKVQFEFPEPSTPPRTGEGVKLDKPRSRGVEAIAMAGLRDAIQSSNALDGLIDAVQVATSLSLQKGSMGDKGVFALARAFREGDVSNLVHLDLSDNGITEKGSGALAQVLAAGSLSGLEYFNLSHNVIREEGSGMLARSLQIGRLPSLQYLNLSHCYIGDDGVKSLTDAMQSVHFSSWGLQFLDLSANTFGEEGVQNISNVLMLGRLPYLYHLDLSFNIFGEKGTEAFGNVLYSGLLAGLTHLLLSRCYLTSGVEPISQALETGKLPHLRVLDLSYNHLGERGTVALAKGLGSGRVSKLQQLVIAECDIAPGRMELLAEAIEIGHVWGLRHLDFSGNFTVARSINSSVSFADSSVENYTHVRKDLGSLSLARLINQGHLGGLQHLNVSRCCMTDDGLIALAEEMEEGHLPKLQRFLLSDNDIRSDRCTKALVRALVSGNLPLLQELDLGHNSIWDDVPTALASALEDRGYENQSPLVKQLMDRHWSTKSPVESALYQSRRFVETHLGLRLRLRRDSIGPTSSVRNIWNRSLRRQSSQSIQKSLDDETLEATGNDHKLFFNVLFVCVWFLAILISKW